MVAPAAVSTFSSSSSSSPSSVAPRTHRRGLLSARAPLPPARTVASSRAPLVVSSPPPTPAPAPGHAKVDRSGRFCSPRAARELALMVSYAACLEGADVVRHFDRRVAARREPGYVFNKACVQSYNFMSFCGGPLEVATEEEAEKLMSQNEKDSANEAEVLSAPPRLVYNNFVLRLARDMLVAVASGWDQHVEVINKIIPQHWKDEPVARILELCILHIAMAEMTSKGTPHKVAINEAVDLAKRFCDGGAPRVINGCLRTYVKDHMNNGPSQAAESKP
ncbi:transcription antitermination protein NusB-like [Triticum dicoccoides]|uniref:transcription antitermination protein NusB-like n=1 Tax=Triticum dicoccoides TaxID=85692 RepID=UPI000E789CE6|nr:transcription antitermination protein NusB-like [Triticum dicoccoides]